MEVCTALVASYCRHSFAEIYSALTELGQEDLFWNKKFWQQLWLLHIESKMLIESWDMYKQGMFLEQDVILEGWTMAEDQPS